LATLDIDDGQTHDGLGIGKRIESEIWRPLLPNSALSSDDLSQLRYEVSGKVQAL
jgi:hypothetical protein